MKIRLREVIRTLREVIQRDLDEGLLKALSEKPCIYDMCDNIIDHDKTYLKQHAKRFTEILQLIPDEPLKYRICDVGAGLGFLSILLKIKGGYTVDAVDLDTSVSFWQERFNKYGISQNAVDISKDHLPFEDATFDIVIFSEVIEHLPSTPFMIMSEFKRVLKKGGYLIITTPNICRLSNIVKLASGQNILPDVSKLTSISSPKTPHVREYSISELKDIVWESGLRLDKLKLSRCWDQWGITPLSLSVKNVPRLSFRMLNNAITFIVPRFRSCVMISAINE